MYGTSIYIDEQKNAKAMAEFYDFAPAPCVCCSCLVPDAQKKRHFLNAYDNKMMLNMPVAPCCCLLDDEMYMTDMTGVWFFDKPPFRSGMCCGCIPCTCCGPPVIFSHNPKYCMIDCKDNFGSTIKYSPCSFFGLKICICCCNPCYVKCSIPIMYGVKNPEVFLSKMKAFTVQFAEKTNIPESQRVVYESVSDNVGDFGGVGQVQMQRS